MNFLKTFLVVAIAGLSFSGCTAIQNFREKLREDPVVLGGPVIDDDTFMLKTQDDSLLPSACLMREKSDDTPQSPEAPAAEAANGSTFADDLSYPATGATTRQGDADRMQHDAIKKCTEAMMLLIDVRWSHFADELNATVANGTTAADIATLGLNIAGGLTPAGTTRVLTAIAAGITGSKSIINEDVLYKNSIQTILLQMKKDRLDKQQLILARLNSTKNPYHDMFEASLDLYAYDRAGTWNEALMSLQADTAAKAAECQAIVKRQKMAIANNATAPDTSLQTAASPCSSGRGETNPPQAGPGDLTMSFDQNSANVTDAAAVTLIQSAIDRFNSGVTDGTISLIKVTGTADGAKKPAATLKANLVKALERQNAVIKALVDKGIDPSKIVRGTPAVTGKKQVTITFVK